MSSAGIRDGIAPKVNPVRAHTSAMPSVEARPPVPPDKLRLGLILPTWTTTDLSWAEVLEVAQTAADVGFDALYVSDHLLIPSNNAELKRRAGVDFPDDPDVELEGYLECFTVLAALAVAIPRLQLGSFVASAGYRNPGLLAKMSATIDDVSGGRLVLGLGAGDSEGEHLAFGFPHEQRVGRFEETLQITRRLFNEGSTDFDGAHHRLRGVRLLPGVRRQGGPPILIGTLNPRARMRRLVAQYADIWNGWLGYTDARPESAATQLRIIDDACREHGRDPNTLVATTAVRGAMPGSGYTPRPDETPLAGPPREMAETLRGHARLGIAEVQVALTMGGPEGVRAFAAVIEELRSGR
ncbi:MAG: LLM class flavin-dependent oxidoreductase [Chloroflexi bacterium]|nr:MAG: LLM class flavin-dependent oxidoreductase [Chloroflexota bacterium]